MLKLTLKNQMTRKSVIVPESTTLRAAFEQANMEYGHGIVMLSGTVVGTNELDKKFSDFGVGESAVLSVNTKTDNAASIIVVGDAAVIKAGFTYEQLKILEKYNPKALTLYEEEDGEKVESFKIGTTEGNGTVSIYGISFADNGADPASVTVQLPAEGREEFLLDKVGVAALKLMKLEETIPAALEQTVADKAAIEALITRF